MIKRLGFILGFLFLFILMIRVLPSRNETGSNTISSWLPEKKNQAEPSAERPPRQTSSVGPAVPLGSAVTGADSRREALAAFERKRKAAGQENAPALPPPLEAYRDMPMTRSRKINGRPYHVLGARAVPRTEYTASMGKVLFEENGFAIVELRNAAGEAWKNLVFHESDRPVVVNSSNGKIAIVTGTLAVKLKDIAAAPQVAAREKLQILSTDPSVNTVYLHAPSGYLLLAGKQRLEKDPDVERVELELYHTRKEGK